MKTTIETINGKEYTVVWYGSKNKLPKPIQWFRMPNREQILLIKELDGGCNVYATALPALPRHPKPEDTPLLHRYAAEGLMVWWADNDKNNPMRNAWMSNPHLVQFNEIARHTDSRTRIEITHAVDKDGNKIDVAIKDDE